LRYSYTEGTNILAVFTTGNTVTAALYNLVDNSPVTLSTSSAIEIQSTGVFKFPITAISVLPTSPSAITEYLWVMGNGSTFKYGKLSLNGFPSEIDKLYKVQFGKWWMTGNQLKLYDLDNTTVLYTFNLYDSTDTPSLSGVVKRIPA